MQEKRNETDSSRPHNKGQKLRMKKVGISETIKNVKICKNSTGNNYLELSNDLIVSELASGTYLLKAGLREATEEIEVFANDKNTSLLFLKESVLDSLGLPEKVRLNIKSDGETFILGPFIGIFISRNKIERLLEGYWDSVYWRFQNWGAEYGGLVYFFDYSGIDWEQRKVDGYCWNNKKEWIQCSYPLPQVIYDRCFGKNSRDIALQLREEIAKRNLSIKV